MAVLAPLLSACALGLLWRVRNELAWRICIPVALAALAAFVAYRIVYALYFSPLRNIPGSLIARVTAKRTELGVIVGYMSSLGQGDFKKYGDIFMQTPVSVTLSNPSDIRALLGNPNVAKADYYKILQFTGIDNTVSTRDSVLANTRHRQLGPFFKPTYLARMERTIMEHGIESIKGKWDRLIEESPGGVAEVNYCNDFLFAAFDVIGTLVYGQQIDELATNDAQTVKWIDTTITYLGIRAMLQLLLRYPFSLLLRPWESRYDKLSNYIHKSIDRRRAHLAELAAAGKSDEKPADLLQAFIDAEDPESKVRMYHDQIHSECVLMMLAGSDTTSHTITWAIHLLMLYPKHYERAVAEVRSRFGASHLITHSDCRAHLPFVEACLLESLRLAPVTGGLLPRVAPTGGMMAQGHFIPEGTTIFVNLAVANHHHKYWENPHEYDPMRFIKNSEARHSIFTFSHGKRMCPGRHLAQWEMLTILANVLKDYDMRLPDDYTHLGPHILGKHGYPKQMDSQQYIVVKPVDPDRDCRLIITKHYK